jgi:hypothetical protein
MKNTIEHYLTSQKYQSNSSKSIDKQVNTLYFELE